jgi:hypothetical protein
MVSLFLLAKNYKSTNSSIVVVDPNETGSLFVAYKNSSYILKGQTAIIRFNITLAEMKTYNLTIVFNSSSDTFELRNLIILSVGQNFPCLVTTESQVNFLNG